MSDSSPHSIPDLIAQARAFVNGRSPTWLAASSNYKAVMFIRQLAAHLEVLNAERDTDEAEHE